MTTQQTNEYNERVELIKKAIETVEHELAIKQHNNGTVFDIFLLQH